MAKLFVEESGSAEMLAYCQQPGCEIWLLDLAGVEFSSLIWRRVREKQLSHGAALQVLALLDAQLQAWNTLAISPALLKCASGLLAEHAQDDGLRTLDAIQLAGFGWMNDVSGAVFATADQRLCAIARKRGYQTFNPDAVLQ